jgi:hypothetical protein
MLAIGSQSLAALLYLELPALIDEEVLFEPFDPLPRYRFLCGLVVHEHEVVRLAEKVADRAVRPD